MNGMSQFPKNNEASNNKTEEDFEARSVKSVPLDDNFGDYDNVDEEFTFFETLESSGLAINNKNNNNKNNGGNGNQGGTNLQTKTQRKSTGASRGT
eukprot:14910144-Ditylum_brightwellii.AAC.1